MTHAWHILMLIRRRLRWRGGCACWCRRAGYSFKGSPIKVDYVRGKRDLGPRGPGIGAPPGGRTAPRSTGWRILWCVTCRLSRRAT